MFSDRVTILVFISIAFLITIGLYFLEPKCLKKDFNFGDSNFGIKGNYCEWRVLGEK